MKEVKSIKIDGDNSSILSVSIIDILNCIDDQEGLNWGLFWLEASGELPGDMSMVDFEKEINHSQEGKVITWEELKDLGERFYQIIDLLLIGDEQSFNIKRYESDDQMYGSCDYTIELIDSSYWIIHSTKMNSLRRMQELLEGGSYIGEKGEF